MATPKTIIIKLKNPDPAILPALTVFNTAILPKKAFEAAPGATDEEKAKAFAEHPISSGPFVLQSGSAAHDEAGAQRELLAHGRGRASRSPISTASTSRSFRTTPHAS